VAPPDDDNPGFHLPKIPGNYTNDDHQDDFDDESEADEADNKEHLFRMRSGRQDQFGPNNNIPQTQSIRQVVPPDRLVASPAAYCKIGFPGENMGLYHCGCDPTQKVRSGKLNQQYITSLQWDRMVNMLCGSTLGAMWAELKTNTDQDYNTIKHLNPALFSIQVNADDNTTWDQAMGGENAEGYWQACIKEYEVLLKKEVWVKVLK
jgi:hypothetical protein